MLDKKVLENNFQNTLLFARQMDEKDPLKSYRELFYIPKIAGKETIYFCGNSLGLQPKSVRKYVEQELKDWETLGVEGHFHGKNAWYYYHNFLTKASANVVGAKPKEVVVMNALTVNLHLMLLSFYRPTPQRYKIIIEHPAFPSDQYAVASQAQLHGFDPEKAIIEVKARPDEHTLRTEDILATIAEHGDELATVMLGGVNYYTGQFFDLQAITKAAHEVGATAGFDLAHAAGNMPMQLHDWNVDFAVWCSYKYLNSGPGGTSGVYVHERHGNNPNQFRLAGWWGNNEETRFEMPDKFVPQAGAAGWQLSNAQVLPMAVHLASLEIFEQAGMAALRQKSELLTAYLEFLLNELNQQAGKSLFNIITPSDPQWRGCQVSILTDEKGKMVFDRLTEAGVIADWRKPNVIRVAPVPLYNTFEEVYRFVTIIREALFE